MSEALQAVYAKLDEQAQVASEYGDTSYGAMLLKSIDAARLWITTFHNDVARDTWLVPEIRHNDAECAVFIWRHGAKALAVYVDSRGVEVLRQYNLSSVCKECHAVQEQYEEKDIDATDADAMRTAWQWLHSPYRFAVGDMVEVVQYDKDYRHTLTGKQGTIAAHSVHDFIVPGYDVLIEGETGPDKYPYAALSERSLQLAQQ